MNGSISKLLEICRTNKSALYKTERDIINIKTDMNKAKEEIDNILGKKCPPYKLLNERIIRLRNEDDCNYRLNNYYIIIELEKIKSELRKWLLQEDLKC